MNKSCIICETIFDAGIKTFDRRKCCSKECSNIWKSNLTKGRPKSEQHKIKIGLSNLGKKRKPFSKEWLENLSKARKGKKFSKEHVENLTKNNFVRINSTPHFGKYIHIKVNNHPFSSKKGYIREHRLVMERHIGRYLLLTEVVHHINNIRDDNRIENLMLLENDSSHSKLHAELRKVNK